MITLPQTMVGENRRLVHYQPMDFPSWPVQISNHRMAIRLNFNSPAISWWTKKCHGNVADSSCELPDFNRKKYSNTSRYPGNGNRYPPGHEHGYHAGIKGCRFAPPNFQFKIQKIIHSMRTSKSIEVTEISKTTPFCGRSSMQKKLLQLTAFKWVLLQSSKLLRLEDLGSFLQQFLWLFVFGVCSGFRVMFRGGGSKHLWKTELDWVLGIPFRV
jgi:hypothetical protein